MSVAGRLEGVDVDNYGEELEDLRRRFQLLEGDRKAFYKTSLNTMQKNKEQIKQLQTENKMLRVELKTRVSDLLYIYGVEYSKWGNRRNRFIQEE